jgi:hypothetical protein
MGDLGTIQVRAGILLPIVDCKKWRVIHGNPDCADGHSLAGCGSCPHRVSREGNLTDPPVLGGVGAPKVGRAAPRQASDPVEDPAPSRWRGLGDVVASATKAVGIKPCGGCQRRREALNRMVPFGASQPAAPEGGPEPKP